MRHFFMIATAWVLLAMGAVAFGSTLNFSAVENATVTFYGDTDTFTFEPDAGMYTFVPTPQAWDFQITSVVNPEDPDSVGLFGNIEGVFTVGAISASDPMPGVHMEYASVSGEGVFSIVDEAGVPLTATLEWRNICTLGTGGSLNVGGSINLTGIAYYGANADLLHLLEAGEGAGTVSFQFEPPKALGALLADGQVSSTSYSGSAVPEPGTVLLLGSGLVGLAALRRRRAQ